MEETEKLSGEAGLAGGPEGCVGGLAAQHPQCSGAGCPLAQPGPQPLAPPWPLQLTNSRARGWAWEGQAEQPGREGISHLAPCLLLFFSSLHT